jgi:uncharacterized protein (DUF427 family)
MWLPVEGHAELADRRWHREGKARTVQYHVRAALHAGVPWCYQDPIPECPRIAGLVCFDESRVGVGAEVS